MNNSFLQDLALGIQRHEGWFPGSYSYRNLNPGNLRGTDGKFLIFPTYTDGFNALLYDIKVKILGTASSIQRYMKKTNKKYGEVTFYEMISIYAPSEDNNDPLAYANYLIKFMQGYDLSLNMTLEKIAQRYIMYPFTINKLSKNAQILRLERAIVRSSGLLLQSLKRALARIRGSTRL